MTRPLSLFSLFSAHCYVGNSVRRQFATLTAVEITPGSSKIDLPTIPPGRIQECRTVNRRPTVRYRPRRRKRRSGRGQNPQQFLLGGFENVAPVRF